MSEQIGTRPVYVPIFDSLFESSIMKEAVETRFVWIALLRLAWRPRANGVVDIDPDMFAMSINMEPAVVREAVRRLMEPDPSSACSDYEGRRVIPLNPERPERGWRLVSWEKYKTLLHRAGETVRKAQQRAREKELSGQVTEVHHETKRNDTIRNEKKEEATGGVRPPPATKRKPFEPPGFDEVLAYFQEKEWPEREGRKFFAYYNSIDWMVKKGVRMAKWKAAAAGWVLRSSGG